MKRQIAPLGGKKKRGSRNCINEKRERIGSAISVGEKATYRKSNKSDGASGAEINRALRLEAGSLPFSSRGVSSEIHLTTLGGNAHHEKKKKGCLSTRGKTQKSGPLGLKERGASCFRC